MKREIYLHDVYKSTAVAGAYTINIRSDHTEECSNIDSHFTTNAPDEITAEYIWFKII